MPTVNQRSGADLDAWCWQLQTLEDLAQFVRRHGPASASPLPALNWTVGVTRQAFAELPAHAHADPVAVLKAFAAVLGTEVTVRHLPDRTVYAVRGRMGRKDGPMLQPRTQVAVRAVVRHPLEDEEND